MVSVKGRGCNAVGRGNNRTDKTMVLLRSRTEFVMGVTALLDNVVSFGDDLLTHVVPLFTISWFPCNTTAHLSVQERAHLDTAIETLETNRSTTPVVDDGMGAKILL